MRKLAIITIGMEYGRLVAIERLEKKAASGSRIYQCRCRCGGIVEVSGPSLLSGNTQSCGCLQRERASEASRARIRPRKEYDIDGVLYIEEYRTWKRILRRCTNRTDGNYPLWGGRGIKVCERWLLSFVDFLRDMGRRPGRGWSIGRIDNDGDYCPENCRWETIGQQNDNKRNTRRLVIDGQRKTLNEWARIVGIHPETLRGRLRAGHQPKQAVFKSVNEKLSKLRRAGITGRKKAL